MSSLPTPFQYHFALHPKIYVAPYTPTPIETIDADVNKNIWAPIPWSSDFDDIRGDDAPAEDRPTSACRTRFKMMWDDDYLYILAMVESDMEVRATFTERNSPIFQQDSDFEVFVDPLSSCHFYKELEVNPLNTVWNLMLDKPYWDGGSEHSGRIARPGDANYYDVEHQKTAIKIVEGSINNNAEKQKTIWAVEIALSHQDTLKHLVKKGRVRMGNESLLPVIGDLWRLNFSRVEKKGDINWTWQEQRVWDAALGKHAGKIDMHLPDAWGYVRFGSSISSLNLNQPAIIAAAGEIPKEKIQNGEGDPSWPLKLAVANIYYAQRQYKNAHNEFAGNLDSLQALLDIKIFDPLDSNLMKLSLSEGGYLFEVTSNALGQTVSITHDRLMKVKMTQSVQTTKDH